MKWKKIAKKIYVFLFGEKKVINEIQGCNKAKKLTKLPRVTFVIPARNEEKSIGKCIQAIIDDNYPKTEILVIDDLSSDRTVDIVKEFQKKTKKVEIRLILNKHRQGPSPNRNIGYKEGKGEILIMFDAHSIIITKNFVKTYLLYFEDKTVGAVAGGRSWTPKYYQDKVLYYAGGVRPWTEMGFQFLDNPNAAYRKTVMREMNGIDENIVWGSDLSSTFKVLTLGYRIPVAQDAEITIDHAVTPNRKIDFIRKHFLYGTNIPYIMLDYFKWLWKRKVDLRIILSGLINLAAIITFLFYPVLWWVPVVTILGARLHSIAFAVYNNAPLKYIIGMPLFLTISEISYSIGFMYGWIRRLFGVRSFAYSKTRSS